MAPILLKIQSEDKSFSQLASLDDEEELSKTWRICTKVKDSIENGSRLENLSWRLWHLHQKSLLLDHQNASIREHRPVATERRRDLRKVSAETTRKLELDAASVAAGSGTSALLPSKDPSLNKEALRQLQLPSLHFSQESVVKSRSNIAGNCGETMAVVLEGCRNQVSGSPAPSLEDFLADDPNLYQEVGIQLDDLFGTFSATAYLGNAEEGPRLEIPLVQSPQQTALMAAPNFPAVSSSWVKHEAVFLPQGQGPNSRASSPGLSSLRAAQQEAASHVLSQSVPSYGIVSRPETPLETVSVGSNTPGAGSQCSGTSANGFPFPPQPVSQASNVAAARRYSLQQPPSYHPGMSSVQPVPFSGYARMDADMHRGESASALPQGAVPVGAPQHSTHSLPPPHQQMFMMPMQIPLPLRPGQLGHFPPHLGIPFLGSLPTMYPPQFSNYTPLPAQAAPVKEEKSKRVAAKEASSSPMEPPPKRQRKSAKQPMQKQAPAQSVPPAPPVVDVVSASLAIGQHKCDNCAATETPIWRRVDGGRILCNACGLYWKSHKQDRPSSLLKTTTVKRRKSVSASPSGCINCKTTTTPLWRKNEMNHVLCNACGLYWKLHRQHRPIHVSEESAKKQAAKQQKQLQDQSHQLRVAQLLQMQQQQPQQRGFVAAAHQVELATLPPPVPRPVSHQPLPSRPSGV